MPRTKRRYGAGFEVITTHIEGHCDDQDHHARQPPQRCWLQLALLSVTLAWLIAVVWVSLSGALATLAQTFMPAFAALVALGIAMPVLAYFTVLPVRRAIDSVGLGWLTWMHVWLIPAAMVFFWCGLLGELPALFWVLAGIGDFLAGCFAATLWWRPATPERLRRIHRFGFADFLVAVGTAWHSRWFATHAWPCSPRCRWHCSRFSAAGWRVRPTSLL